MKRSFNYTDRAKITQRAVHVRLYSDFEGVQVFDADIDLSSYNHLPAGTRIYLEAYYRSAMMRFDVGTFDPDNPKYALRGKRLDDLQHPIVNFRIKLVDVREQIGRLVGLIERVQTFNENSRPVERLGLLPVNFGEDLGHRIWEMQIPDDGDDPMLCINKSVNVDNAILREFVARHPAFVALVFPEALRQILAKLVKDGFDPTDEESWQAKWLRFAVSFGVGLPPDDAEDAEQEAQEWITQVIEAFCLHTNLRTRFEDYLGAESE